MSPDAGTLTRRQSRVQERKARPMWLFMSTPQEADPLVHTCTRSYVDNNTLGLQLCRSGSSSHGHFASDKADSTLYHAHCRKQLEAADPQEAAARLRITHPSGVCKTLQNEPLPVH